jgi:beta-fructofuranosidase
VTTLLAVAFVAFALVDTRSATGNELNLQELVDNTRTLRELMQSDPYRPIYHFVAPEGHALPFDPNGAIYWKGKYHLGYIYQKMIDGKERHVWGHVVSTDLFHWTIYPDMLDVDLGDPEEGIFSGGAFLSKDGTPHLAYYGLGASESLLAYATDDELKHWKKLSNPILKAPNPTDPGETSCCVAPKGKFSVYDPDVWYDEKSDFYYQISGGMKPSLFRSRDLSKWEYLGDLITPSQKMNFAFEDVSCPALFSIGEKWMLLFISHSLGTQYYIGDFLNSKFIPERHGRMTWPGGSLFAAEQLRDSKGRNIIWAWVLDHKPSYMRDYGWSGTMSLPRVVSLDNTGELQITVPTEIDAIRLNELKEDDVMLEPNGKETLRANGRSIELKVELKGGTRSAYGVEVFSSSDGREGTVIRYDPQQEQLVIDFTRSSIRGPVSVETIGRETKEFFKPIIERVSEQKAPLKLKSGETLKLDIFLDRSIIEVFANGRQAVTQVVYPELEGSTEVKVFSEGEVVNARNIRSWQMAETNAY